MGGRKELLLALGHLGLDLSGGLCWKASARARGDPAEAALQDPAPIGTVCQR